MSQKRGKKFEYAIKKLLGFLNIRYIHIEYRCPNCGKIINAQNKGFPDFLCFYPKKSKTFAIESKTGSGKLTKGQKEYKRIIKDCGMDFLEVHDTVDKIIKYVKELDEGR